MSSPAPLFSTNYFGASTCAVCLQEVRDRDRRLELMATPLVGAGGRAEVLIPAGRHTFHSNCWGVASSLRRVLQLRKEIRGRRSSGTRITSDILITGTR